MRTIRYLAIAEDLRRRIGAGEVPAGSVLPSESELSATYDASRVTVRRALEALRGEGLVESRQGYGWLVATDPVVQDLSRLGTIEAQLAAAGVSSERRILSFGFTPAPRRLRGLIAEANVLEVRRVNLADGEPFARVTVWCPESLASDLSRDDVTRATFLEQLPVEPAGATQTIGAELCSAEDATLLGVPAGSPVLVAERITRGADGAVVLVGEHVFPAHRTRFVVDLPGARDVDATPTGLRLVE